MNKIAMLGIVALVVGVVGFGVLNQVSDDAQPMTEAELSRQADLQAGEIGQNENLSDQTTQTTPVEKSKYVPFSPEVLASTVTTRQVLFFYANWCPTCRSAEASFNQNLDQIPADATLIRVNYNDTDTDQVEKELARKYGITYQHTFVEIDDAGNELKKWNGGEIEELLENLR